MKKASFKEMLQISQNIYNIHQKLVKCKNKEEKTKQLENLALALEYEDELYQNITVQTATEVSNYLSILPQIGVLNNIDTVHPLNKPLYRIWMNIAKRINSNLKSQIDYYFEYEDDYLDQEISQRQKDIDTENFLNEKMILIYLNVLKRYKKRDIENYYDVLFLCPELEKLLMHRRLNAPLIYEIDLFLSTNRRILLEKNKETEFSNSCKEELLSFWESFLDVNHSPLLTDKAYIGAIVHYFMLSLNDGKEFAGKIESSFYDKQISPEKRIILQKFFKDIEKIEEGSIIGAKRILKGENI
ncbi:MAG: hypothetical protein HFI09_00845 [Bacilli bacterium]|nr:hypothetical protein [Bacilli bacterium]